MYISARRNAMRKGGKQGWREWHIRYHENVARLAGSWFWPTLFLLKLWAFGRMAGRILP